jgi:hypothetical protein
MQKLGENGGKFQVMDLRCKQKQKRGLASVFNHLPERLVSGL